MIKRIPLPIDKKVKTKSRKTKQAIKANQMMTTAEREREAEFQNWRRVRFVDIYTGKVVVADRHTIFDQEHRYKICGS
jgi:hypothetical protein